MWTVFDTRVTSAVVLAGYVLLTGRGLSLKGQNVPVLAAIGILLAAANFLFIVADRHRATSASRASSARCRRSS